MNLVLLGPPGAGKGTLATLLLEEMKIAAYSTGDILRSEIKNKTELGLKAQSFIEKGKLVPDEVVIKIIENTLSTDEKAKKGYMLDGFPRTRRQAEELDKILQKLNMPLDYTIYLDAGLPMIIKRLTGRRVCKNCGATYHVENRPPKQEGKCDKCGGDLYQRPDDNEEAIKTRMQEYKNNTQPVVEYYESQGILKRLDGDKESEHLRDELMKIFHEDGKLHQD